MALLIRRTWQTAPKKRKFGEPTFFGFFRTVQERKEKKEKAGPRRKEKRDAAQFVCSSLLLCNSSLDDRIVSLEISFEFGEKPKKLALEEKERPQSKCPVVWSATHRKMVAVCLFRM